MNRYRLHEGKTEPTGEYPCNWDWVVSDLKVGDFLSVEWPKVTVGIPNGYQCYILSINESSIRVLVEEQPASSTGWCYETISKDVFKKRFWATNIHRRNVDIDKLIAQFAEQGTEISPVPLKAKTLFGLPIS